jgi:pimeloyl-ACP methyl ester carboxylesterase
MLGVVWPTEQQIAEVKQPVVIVQGADDLIFKADTIPTLASYFSHDDVTVEIVPDTAHNIMMERPELIAKHITQLLQKLLV